MLSTITVPAGVITADPQPYSPELMEQVMGEMCAHQQDFTGFISIASNEILYLLFFFKNHPYAAGKSIGEKPFSLSLREFFQEISQSEASCAATLTIHATDPVLLKSLLIFIQEDPVVKAPSNLINLEAILGQIQQDGRDALIILEKKQMFNFFFFKDGKRGIAYFSDSEFNAGQDLATDEQMLLYAFQGNDVSVDALVYRSVTTREAIDSETVDLKEMLQLLRGNSTGRTTEAGPNLPAAEHFEYDLILSVLSGPQRGETLTGRAPCLMGRKEADIIVSDAMTSKRHAAVQVVNGKLMLVDLNSTNGTTLNGNRIHQHELFTGDIIGMGSTSLKVVQIKHK